MADISKVRMLNGTEYNYKDAKARADIATLNESLEDVRADLVNAGMSSTAKAALLACLRNIVWTSGQGKTYYNALASAFNDDIYPQIRVTFSPGTTKFYSDNALDTLKTYLTVKYYESSQSSGTIITASNYTLSGELVDGENSVVVATYGNYIKAFSVPVESFYNKYHWSLADGDFEIIWGTVLSKAGNGMAIGNAENSRYTAVVEHGKRTYVKNGDGSDMGVYPIPVPPNATKIRVEIAPSTQYISFGLRALLETGYYRGWADKWLDYTEGEIELDFTEWKVENLYLSITTKYDSAGSTYPTAPTDLVIDFED